MDSRGKAISSFRMKLCKKYVLKNKTKQTVKKTPILLYIIIYFDSLMTFLMTRYVDKKTAVKVTSFVYNSSELLYLLSNQVPEK